MSDGLDGRGIGRLASCHESTVPVLAAAAATPVVGVVVVHGEQRVPPPKQLDLPIVYSAALLNAAETHLLPEALGDKNQGLLLAAPPEGRDAVRPPVGTENVLLEKGDAVSRRRGLPLCLIELIVDEHHVPLAGLLEGIVGGRGRAFVGGGGRGGGHGALARQYEKL